MAITPDEIIRSPRKTLAITIDASNRIIVRAPLTISEARIFTFLSEKESWIVKKKAEREGVGICLPPESLDKYALLLLGKTHTLSLADVKKIVYDEANRTIFLPKEKSQERLVKWLKENAKRIFTALTEDTAKRMGVSFRSVTITSTRGRWGSCSAENAIRYTFRLLYAPKDVIEYVVIHELSHVKHKNHSKAFWTEVEKYAPNWKECRKWLRLRGVLMEIF